MLIYVPWGILFHMSQPYDAELASEASGLEALLENCWQEILASLHSSSIAIEGGGGTVEDEDI